MNPNPGESASQTCIVIPCYNEANRFDSAAFERFLAQTEHINFLLVNDGSSDSTQALLEGHAQKHPERVNALNVVPNQGKGEAVRRGMLQAFESGKYSTVGYWDADLATPLEAIEEFVRVLDRLAHVDIVFGARIALLGRHIDRKPSRHYLGRIFATAASVVLALPIYDTQCGAKLFRANDKCRQLFETRFGSRWIFDVELVARYCQTSRGETGIYELPLEHWRDVGASTVRPIDFLRAIGEMVLIYRKYALSERGNRLLAFVTAPFIRYAGAGAVGTLFHYGTLTVAVELFKATPVVGSLLGATVGAIVNYVLNYHLTFASQQSHKVTLPRFLVVAAFGVLLSGLVVKLSTERLHFHYLLAQGVATVIVLASGFVLNRVWTFAQRD